MFTLMGTKKLTILCSENFLNAFSNTYFHALSNTFFNTFFNALPNTSFQCIIEHIPSLHYPTHSSVNYPAHSFNVFSNKIFQCNIQHNISMQYPTQSFNALFKPFSQNVSQYIHSLQYPTHSFNVIMNISFHSNAFKFIQNFLSMLSPKHFLKLIQQLPKCISLRNLLKYIIQHIISMQYST